MKSFAVTAALAALAATPCLAQVSVFYPYEAKVYIDCVLANDGSQPAGAYSAYRVHLLKIDKDRFLLLDTEPREYDAECTGSFDASTNLYRDIVNVGDESYSVGLRRTGKDAFQLEWATWRGPATSSLWKATNGENTVYLAGTIHILRQYDYPLPRVFAEAYAKASELYFEIDMDDPQETGGQLTVEQIHSEMRDPQGRLLTQTLTPENYNALRNFMQARSLSIELVNAWSVPALLNLLASYELSVSYHFDANGVDAHIANLAIADGKPVHGLESRALHTGLLQIGDDRDENAQVTAFLADMGSGAILHQLEQLVAVWRKGDSEWIRENSIEPMRAQDPDYYRRIHADRNNAWVPQIVNMLQTAPTEMVVVGAAHMAGEDGLLMQLRRLGYRVEKY